VSLSSDVSPEMREWERFSTTAANAYVQPMMVRYLRLLEDGLRGMGATAPIFLMLSGGGLTTIDTACRFPIRLVESGPAGGALFSADIARRSGLNAVLSFAAAGQLNVEFQSVPLDGISAAWDRQARGEAPVRIVVTC